MNTRSSRQLPFDFIENQPILGLQYRGTMKKQQTYHEWYKEMKETKPTVPAAFPTLDEPPPPAPPAPPEERLRWERGKNRDKKPDGTLKRRIDMTADDLYNELMGDNTFLNARGGFEEVGLPDLGKGDWSHTYVATGSEYDRLGRLNTQGFCDAMDPGELELDLFHDAESEENQPKKVRVAHIITT